MEFRRRASTTTTTDDEQQSNGASKDKSTLSADSSICVFCNATFPQSSTTNNNLCITNPTDLKRLGNIFIDIFEISKCHFVEPPSSPTAETEEENSNNMEFLKSPFCPTCTVLVKSIDKMYNEILELEKKMNSIRDTLAASAVHTYVYASLESPYFRTKHLIFRQWYAKVQGKNSTTNDNDNEGAGAIIPKKIETETECVNSTDDDDDAQTSSTSAPLTVETPKSASIPSTTLTVNGKPVSKKPFVGPASKKQKFLSQGTDGTKNSASPNPTNISPVPVAVGNNPKPSTSSSIVNNNTPKKPFMGPLSKKRKMEAAELKAKETGIKKLKPTEENEADTTNEGTCDDDESLETDQHHPISDNDSDETVVTPAKKQTSSPSPISRTKKKSPVLSEKQKLGTLASMMFRNMKNKRKTEHSPPQPQPTPTPPVSKPGPARSKVTKPVCDSSKNEPKDGGGSSSTPAASRVVIVGSDTDDDDENDTDKTQVQVVQDEEQKKEQEDEEEDEDDDVCKVCYKVCRSKELLKLHMISHEGNDKKHKCADCGKTFYGSSLLRKHMKTVHDKILEVSASSSPMKQTGYDKSPTKAIRSGANAGSSTSSTVIGFGGRRSDKMEIDDDDEETPPKVEDKHQRKGVCKICGMNCGNRKNKAKHMRRVHNRHATKLQGEEETGTGTGRSKSPVISDDEPTHDDNHHDDVSDHSNVEQEPIDTSSSEPPPEEPIAGPSTATTTTTEYECPQCSQQGKTKLFSRLRDYRSHFSKSHAGLEYFPPIEIEREARQVRGGSTSEPEPTKPSSSPPALRARQRVDIRKLNFNLKVVLHRSEVRKYLKYLKKKKQKDSDSKVPPKGIHEIVQDVFRNRSPARANGTSAPDDSDAESHASSSSKSLSPTAWKKNASWFTQQTSAGTTSAPTPPPIFKPPSLLKSKGTPNPNQLALIKKRRHRPCSRSPTRSKITGSSNSSSLPRKELNKKDHGVSTDADNDDEEELPDIIDEDTTTNKQDYWESPANILTSPNTIKSIASSESSVLQSHVSRPRPLSVSRPLIKPLSQSQTHPPPPQRRPVATKKTSRGPPPKPKTLKKPTPPQTAKVAQLARNLHAAGAGIFSNNTTSTSTTPTFAKPTAPKPLRFKDRTTEFDPTESLIPLGRGNLPEVAATAHGGLKISSISKSSWKKPLPTTGCGGKSNGGRFSPPPVYVAASRNKDKGDKGKGKGGKDSSADDDDDDEEFDPSMFVEVGTEFIPPPPLPPAITTPSTAASTKSIQTPPVNKPGPKSTKINMPIKPKPTPAAASSSQSSADTIPAGIKIVDLDEIIRGAGVSDVANGTSTPTSTTPVPSAPATPSGSATPTAATSAAQLKPEGIVNTDGQDDDDEEEEDCPIRIRSIQSLAEIDTSGEQDDDDDDNVNDQGNPTTNNNMAQNNDKNIEVIDLEDNDATFAPSYTIHHRLPGPAPPPARRLLPPLQHHHLPRLPPPPSYQNRTITTGLSMMMSGSSTSTSSFNNNSPILSSSLNNTPSGVKAVYLPPPKPYIGRTPTRINKINQSALPSPRTNNNTTIYQSAYPNPTLLVSSSSSSTSCTNTNNISTVLSFANTTLGGSGGGGLQSNYYGTSTSGGSAAPSRRINSSYNNNASSSSSSIFSSASPTRYQHDPNPTADTDEVNLDFLSSLL